VVARQAVHDALVSPADVADVAGWVVTESGRQPWIATGILRTADAISPVSASQVLTTLILFVVVYGIVFAMGIYYMNRLINQGPQDHAPAKDDEALPNRPLAAAHDAGREALGSR
jgi:cytochrome d ubiquinol oxidase subunit I